MHTALLLMLNDMNAMNTNRLCNISSSKSMNKTTW